MRTRPKNTRVAKLARAADADADVVCEAMRASRFGDDDPDWYRVVPQSHRLWRGMEEFV